MQTTSSSELEVALRPQPVVNDAGEATGDPIMDRLPLLWEKRKFLFRITAYGLLAFTVIAFLIPKRYQSTAQLMPPESQSSSGMALAAEFAQKLGGALAGLSESALGLKSSGELFVGIFRSRTVQDELINKFDLRRVYREQLYEEARRKLTANTLISEDRESGIITITVTDTNPQRATAMAQEYITELNSVVSQLTTSSARREREFLEGRLIQVREDLETAEKDFSQFASKNATVDIKEQGRAMVGAAATLQGELIAAESQLQGLKQIYAENNVRIRSLRARIAELQRQMQQMGGREEIATDATSEQNGQLYPSIRKLPLLGVPYADLYRRTRVQEALFETLTREYELAKVTEAKEIPSVKVLDPPNVPERKSFPPRLLIMVLGAFFSFGLGVIWISGDALWREIRPQAPQKIFVREVVRSVNATMPWAPPNGSLIQAASHKVWTRLVRRRPRLEKNSHNMQ
jgi:capsule polysaccharide export protein KpsE/RkpR